MHDEIFLFALKSIWLYTFGISLQSEVTLRFAI